MANNLGLSVNDVVTVSVQLAPNAAAQRNFGSLLILGDSAIIDTQSRMRLYTSLAAIGNDLGTSAPEYQAAAIYFGATPQPTQVYVGAWARTATNGALVGAVLSASQQALANFNAITNGSFGVLVDGSPHSLTSLNLTGITNLNGVASVIQGALIGIGTITWDANNNQFNVRSTSTGTSSSVGFFTSSGVGTDLSQLLGLSASSSGAYAVAGIAAETAVAAVNACANVSNAWYGLTFASSVMPSDPDFVAVASTIQGSTVSRIFGVTVMEAGALVPSINNDLASLLNFSRTFTQYSSSNPYAVAGIFGDAFTVNFNGAGTTITLKFKQEGGITPETLTETQAASLLAKNCNVFVNYNNGTAILQEGKMSNGFFFDTVHGTDWLQNAIQTAIYNLFITTQTKVPQTDAGVTQILGVVSQAIIQGVTNGLIAPGVWTGPSFGALTTGDTLSAGYYIFAPPVSSQTTAARGARQAPVLTAGIKLAGAIHSAAVILNVNN